MNHIKLSFDIAEQDKKETLMALLSVFELTGFEETEDQLIAYLEESNYEEEKIKELTEQLNLGFSKETIPQRNWNEEWEQNFQSVIIDGFCSVRAGFHPKPENVAYDIVITPKMSFGTGHHATTALMIALMRDLDFKGKQVFDFGTGTGILAILADQLEAASVLAIDNDEWSYLNALENCAFNKAGKVTVQQATADDLPQDASFDIILANINRHILLSYMDKMAGLLQQGGTLLLSGILPEDVNMVTDAALQHGFIKQQEREDRNWVCIRLLKPKGN